MHDPLIKLMTLDRLVDLIGHDRLRALVERQLPVIELLEALGGKDTIDAAAVRTLLAALPASPAASPGPVSSPDPRGDLDGYLAAIGELLDFVPTEQPIAIPNPRPSQIHVGPNFLLKNGVPAGYCHTSIIDPTATPLQWRERFLLTDKDAWLKGEVEIQNEESGWPDWDHTDDHARARRNADLGRTDVISRFMMTLDFYYWSLPPATSVDKVATLAGKFPGERRHFDAIIVDGTSAAPKGRILREISPIGAATVVIDHWTLAADYKPPQKTISLAFEPVTGAVPSLKAFFDHARAQGHAWYVQTVYHIQPV